MSFKRMTLSASGKLILDNYTEILDCKRPFILKIAFAKGFLEEGTLNEALSENEKGWDIPDVFSNEEELLFRHLIIEKLQEEADDQKIQSELIRYIEIGLKRLQKLNKNRNSLDDIRSLILS